VRVFLGMHAVILMRARLFLGTNVWIDELLR
jgi:hypothetical protein